ncbi:hypothetical protein AMATHDRAFT_67950 [Amanita thiersii Skay4041]|uniref:Purine-cytosine permease n=1 Tax=Amanita thiersii Skay4041 TaxID=703135 RepID=A0A2A9N8W3_9AGAR|nr:hypothetical protein AMATHDRAFT_67950 [Amanita thiersii Skay4041]
MSSSSKSPSQRISMVNATAPEMPIHHNQGIRITMEPVNYVQRITNFLLRWGIETHGIAPIKPEARTDTRLYQMFFVWFSANFNILALSTGSAGPAFFGLGLRHSLLVIFFADLVMCAVPAYFAVFGPKLGMRGMVQARYSWGYYAAVIPSLLNVFSMQGFLIANCIIGGQVLASISDKLNATLGIVIIGVLSLIICFCGYKVVHWFESFSWIPNLIIFPILLGVGGKHLNPANFVTPDPPTPASVISFITFISSSVISWCTMTPDYGVYHNGKASSVRIFLYTYFGFFAASVKDLKSTSISTQYSLWCQLPAHMIGAAFAAAASSVPSWKTGFEGGTNLGGLVSAILAPTGGFGKFLIVVLSLCVTSAGAPTMYTFGTSFMSIAPIFAKVPRYVYVLISEAILIPVGIIGATRFYLVLVNILSVIGYWSSAFAGIVFTEHFLFRKGRFSNYDLDDYDHPRGLPLGLASLFAFLAAVGIIVPSMSQAWYTGPIAKAGTGDIGVFTGFFVAVLFYGVLRSVEKRYWDSRQQGVIALKS